MGETGATISIIAAVAVNGVIGREGTMPWRIPDDMARFRRLTMGHPVIMGRGTFLSLGRPLAGRINIVLSRDGNLRLPECFVVHSAEEAQLAAGPAETFVIGGTAVYALFLPRAEKLFMTWIDAEFEGDAVFPEVPWDQWEEVIETNGTGGPGIPPHRFVDYRRRRS